MLRLPATAITPPGQRPAAIRETCKGKGHRKGYDRDTARNKPCLKPPGKEKDDTQDKADDEYNGSDEGHPVAQAEPKAFLFGLVGRYDLNVNLYAMNIVWHVTASD